MLYIPDFVEVIEPQQPINLTRMRDNIDSTTKQFDDQDYLTKAGRGCLLI